MSDNDQRDDNDPFAGCILHEAVKNGTYNPDYRYPSNGLPDIGPDPVRGESPFIRALNRAQALERAQKEGKA